ncbi:MAG: hypothetical protein CL908_20795 [Deltaproteobacteria bacterium]|nr:hypothetical protein [Deltaproteobacteria bacterium]
MSQAWDGALSKSTTDRIEIPGAVVERVFEPKSTGELSEIITAAAADRQGLLTCCGRTRLHLANPAREIEAAISLAGLSGIQEFEPEEGVVYVAAGTPIAEIREEVAVEGWELPLDPPGRTSTVGGTVASAATGPRAHVFGGVSDAILGLDVVGADGVASKCGGRVVKNVTGYDLAKLYCGTFGTLAVITGAWLRLRPQPRIRQVLRAWPGSAPKVFERCRALSRLASVRAMVWEEVPGEGAPEVCIELGGSEEGVAHDRDRISESLDVDRISMDRIDSLRDARVVTPAGAAEDEVVLRARVLGSESEALVNAMLECGLAITVDAGLGVIHARGEVAEPGVLRSIRERAIAGGGFAIFEVLPEPWRSEFDVFGPQNGTESLMVSLKERFDPAGILNPGRFVAGS